MDEYDETQHVEALLREFGFDDVDVDESFDPGEEWDA